jgi:hypothetical protein
VVVNEHFLLYEINIDGTGLRQMTVGADRRQSALAVSGRRATSVSIECGMPTQAWQILKDLRRCFR